MSSDQFEFDTAQNSPALNYLRGIRDAKKCGKSMMSMIWEIMRLRMGTGHLRADEYFMYRLYDDARFTPEVKRTFLSESGNQVNNPWAKVARDKPALTAMLMGLGLPVPETQAIVHQTRTFGDAVPLRDRDAICSFLREQANYPIFGKPFDSACSMGAAKITRYDLEQDAVLVADQLVQVGAFADMIEALGRDYLFQTLMLPHEKITELIGPSVSSVRMFVISDDQGCSLTRASWKIPATVNDADNFWRTGNVLAGIDVDTGRIVKAMLRTETGGTEPIDAHPITGVSFQDLEFPLWDQMRETVLAAAVNLPACHFQGWDVALTDRGPVLVELEGDGGNPIMEQLCFETGLLNDRYLRVVQKWKESAKIERKKIRAVHKADLRNSLTSLAIPQTSPAAQPEATVETVDTDRDATESYEHVADERVADERVADERVADEQERQPDQGTPIIAPVVTDIPPINTSVNS